MGRNNEERAGRMETAGKTSTTRAGKKTFVARKTCATRKSSGYSAAKKSFGSARASAKPVK